MHNYLQITLAYCNPDSIFYQVYSIYRVLVVFEILRFYILSLSLLNDSRQDGGTAVNLSLR